MADIDMKSTFMNAGPLVLSFALGLLIVVFGSVITGYVAAIPVQREFMEALGGFGGLFGLLHSLLAQVSIAVVACVLCWFLFSLLKRGTGAMVLAGSLPWLLLTLDSWTTSHEAYLRAIMRSPYSALGVATGLLCVPAGIYLAARLTVRHSRVGPPA
jgi:hypothetical protein